MKIIQLITFLSFLMMACHSKENTQEKINTQPELHKVIVEEVFQTSNYTYLGVKEGEAQRWLAVSKQQAAIGETYYYKGGLLMTNFTSKELNRTFNEILFIENISTTEDFVKKATASPSPHGSGVHGSAVSDPETSTKAKNVLGKKDIQISPLEDGITIAALFEKAQSYSGKKIKIKGKVVKYNPGIMNKNWIHIQDGTDYTGKFDLTVTTDVEVKLGDIITLEGIIALNKDFGFGYSYEVIMEEAKIIK